MQPKKPLNEQHAADLKSYLDRQLDRRYSVRGIVRGKTGDGIHCAELASQALNVAGLTTIGANAFQPGGPRENLYSLGDDLTWIAGKHSMKFGFDGRYYRPAGLVQQTPNSILTFENRFSNQPGTAGTATLAVVKPTLPASPATKMCG